MTASRPRTDEVWAIRPCIYQGVRRERGERFSLAGLPTDARLIEERYLQPVRATHSRYDCARCGKAFVGGENYAIHLARAHRMRPTIVRDEAQRP